MKKKNHNVSIRHLNCINYQQRMEIDIYYLTFKKSHLLTGFHDTNAVENIIVYSMQNVSKSLSKL